MIGTQAAVVRASVLGPGLHAQRPIAGLEPVSLRLPIAQIVGDQRLSDPMSAATLEVENVVTLGDDLRRNEVETVLTQAGGLAEKQIRCDSALPASH